MRVGTFVDTVGMGPVIGDPYAIALRVPAEESTERVCTGVRVTTYLVQGTGPIQVFPANVRVTVTGARSRVFAMHPDILRAVVPSGELLDLGEIEDRRVQIHVEGVPSDMSVVVSVDTVSVRRVEQ